MSSPCMSRIDNIMSRIHVKPKKLDMTMSRNIVNSWKCQLLTQFCVKPKKLDMTMSRKLDTILTLSRCQGVSRKKRHIFLTPLTLSTGRVAVRWSGSWANLATSNCFQWASMLLTPRHYQLETTLTQNANTLCTLNFTPSSADPCLYTKLTPTGYFYILVHVDDLVMAAENKTAISDLKNLLHHKYGIEDLGPVRRFTSYQVDR